MGESRRARRERERTHCVHSSVYKFRHQIFPAISSQRVYQRCTNLKRGVQKWRYQTTHVPVVRVRMMTLTRHSIQFWTCPAIYEEGNENTEKEVGRERHRKFGMQ